MPSSKWRMALLTPARRMFFSIRRAWPGSSSIMTMFDRAWRSRGIPSVGEQRQADGVKVRSLRSRADGRHLPPRRRQGAHVGQADALARLVLVAGATEQLEDALVVLRRCRGRCPRPRSARWRPRARRPSMRPGRAGLRYLRAFSIRLPKTCSIAKRSLTTSGTASLDRSRRRVRRPGAASLSACAQQRRHVQRLGRQHAAPLARQLQDGVDQPVHLAGGGADEAERLGQVRLDRLAHGRA